MNMTTSTVTFDFEVFDSIDQLSSDDKALLESARTVTQKAYAPYSEFLVGAVAKLVDGKILKGTNQENASYPVGMCAERALLASTAMLDSNIAIQTMAIAYHNLNGDSDKPVSPCGMCRQSLHEYEERTKQPIRLILSGMSGKVYIIERAGLLLPLSFGSNNLIK
jgi:cytidine deaminase